MKPQCNCSKITCQFLQKVQYFVEYMQNFLQGWKKKEKSNIFTWHTELQMRSCQCTQQSNNVSDGSTVCCLHVYLQSQGKCCMKHSLPAVQRATMFRNRSKNSLCFLKEIRSFTGNKDFAEGSCQIQIFREITLLFCQVCFHFSSYCSRHIFCCFIDVIVLD